MNPRALLAEVEELRARVAAYQPLDPHEAARKQLLFEHCDALAREAIDAARRGDETVRLSMLTHRSITLTTVAIVQSKNRASAELIALLASAASLAEQVHRESTGN